MKLQKQEIFAEQVLEFKEEQSKMYARSTGANTNKMFSITLGGNYVVECFKTNFYLKTSDLQLAVDKYNELP